MHKREESIHKREETMHERKEPMHKGEEPMHKQDSELGEGWLCVVLEERGRWIRTRAPSSTSVSWARCHASNRATTSGSARSSVRSACT